MKIHEEGRSKSCTSPEFANKTSEYRLRTLWKHASQIAFSKLDCLYSHFQRGYNARVDIGRGGFRMVIRVLFSCTNWYYHPQTSPLPVTQECKSNLSTALLRQWILTVSDIKRHDLSRWYSTEPTKQSNPHFQFQSFKVAARTGNDQANIRRPLPLFRVSHTLPHWTWSFPGERSVASTSWTRKLLVAFYVKLIHGCAFFNLRVHYTPSRPSV